jgi:tetratricopeptide (TPR) repeat protein
LSGWRVPVAAAVLAGLAASVYILGDVLEYQRYSGEIVEELTYFPSGRFIKIASIGYETIGADLLWLKGIQYYGEHHKTDKEYLLAEHIFSTIVDIDPHFIGAYRFGAFVLAEDVGNPVLGIELLRKGMRYNRDSWELPFDLGFIYYIHFDNLKRAAHFFRLASRLEGAPPITQRFAAFAFSKAGRLDLARSLWQQIYESSDNPVMRESAVFNLKRIRLREILEALERMVDEYTLKYGRPPQDLKELVAEGLITTVPNDPFGGRYLLDPVTSGVLSTYLVQDQAEHSKRFLEQHLQRYYDRKATYPASISELKNEGFIAEVPSVAGARLLYDPVAGSVDYVYVWE